MNKLNWAMIKAFERLRWAGVAGAVILLVTAGFYVFTIRPLQNELLALEQRGTADRQQQLQRLNKLLAEQNKPAYQYASFVDYFASKEVLPERLATLFNAAGSAGLTLGQADYRLSTSANLPLREFRVTLPLTGNYPAIRQFISGVLNANPGTALEQIRFERRKIGDAAVDAEIRFVIYLPLTP